MAKDIISIIIPVYNAEKYIKRCIESVISQTYTDIEIICINDGSKDDSKAILEEYAKLDNRIKVYNKENGGVSSARNLGIDKASGRYVMFVDADDYIDSHMLQTMYEKMIKQKARMCICGMKVVRDEETVREYRYEEKLLNSKEEYLTYLQVNWAPFCKLIDRELIGDIRYDTKVAIAEDLLFNVMIINENKPVDVAVCEETMYSYVDVPTSAMKSSYSSKMLVGLETEEKVYELLKTIDIEHRLSKVLFSGVITYYFRYATASKEIRNTYREEYNKAYKIVKKHKKYLLEKRQRSIADRWKMRCIVYAPRLYIWLRSLRNN